jgi:hypothetical protein
MGDIDDIKQVKYRYLRALDTKDWETFAGTLTEDVAGDYGESLGEDHRFTDRDGLVEFMRTSLGTWYLQDRVIAADFNFMLIGAAFYRDRYRRTPDGWKISATGYDRTYDASMSLENLDFKLKKGRALHL